MFENSLLAEPVHSTVPSVKTLSPSTLTWYIQCPRQYLYADRLKLKTTTTTIKQVIGTLLHQVLEWRNLQKKHGYPQGIGEDYIAAVQLLTQPNPDNISPIAIKIYEALDTALFDKLLYIQKIQTVHFLKLALENYFTGLHTTADNLEVIGTEEWLKVPLTVNETIITLTGRIDLLAKYPNDRLLLIDYKTNKLGFKESIDKNQQLLEKSVCSEPAWEEQLLSKRFARREIQLPFYWWLLKQTPGYETSKIDVALQFVRPSHQGGSQLVVLNDELLSEQNATFEKITFDTVIPAMLNDTTFKAIGNATACRYCDFNTICERGYTTNHNDDDDEPLEENE